jgi:hypothetical protein
LSILALLALLFFMYSSTFLTDYLMRDEWTNIGNKARVIAAMRWSYNTYGRGLFGLYQKWDYDFVGFDTRRIEIVRFLNLLSLALAAAYLLQFLQTRTKHRELAFFTVLFFLSQPTFQVLMGYSLQLIANTLPAIWLSLLTFHLYFRVFERFRIPVILQTTTVFIILVLAMQSTQTYAFFAVIPLAVLALSDWKANRRKIITFLSVAVGVLLLSTIAYKISLGSLHAAGGQGYKLGEEGLSALSNNPLSVALTALNPLAYWSAFKVWTFPYPLEHVPPLGEPAQLALAVALMVIWLGLIAGAVLIELRASTLEDRKATIEKWLAVTVCFALAAVFVIADSPTSVIDHRPHVLLTFSGMVCVTGAYALSVLRSKLPSLGSRPAGVAGALIVLMIALGARSGTLRNLVQSHWVQMDYVRSALVSKDPNQYRNVIIVLPSLPDVCPAEPCGPWFGETLPDPVHAREPAGYQYALATVGANPNKKKLIFVLERPVAVPEDAVLIDWDAYLLTRMRQLELAN